ncbi:2-amino-4-hydroxy-6-hydroxymethyldihydropteridinepyrophosphokinase [hydrothermal vent metagenome]|uniref:2-amino-4-hydroxy-6-hydroxymethyldihydropteridine diphosphokinase n=1 Tax=hydrothermal vent metagenome TaxID=652676 RepID=A0A3B0YY55_9ZZZZ
MAKAYVSVGSNIDREKNVAAALERMKAEVGELECSRIWETTAVGFEGDAFYNLVVAFDTALSPQELAGLLRSMEDELGRDRSGGKFSSRSMDLDLLLYDDLILDEDGLTLPRPEILEYAFVLCPLAEIAGSIKHPVTGFTFAMIWDQFDPTSQPMWPVDH